MKKCLNCGKEVETVVLLDKFELCMDCWNARIKKKLGEIGAS